MNEEISHLLNDPSVTVKSWCSFCNSRPSDGRVKFDLAPGMPVDLNICGVCVDQARAEGFQIEDLTDQSE